MAFFMLVETLNGYISSVKMKQAQSCDSKTDVKKLNLASGADSSSITLTDILLGSPCTDINM